MKNLLIIIFIVAIALKSTAQTDTLRTELRRYVARNFSEARTFNFYWETSPNYDYTLKQDGETLEKGKIRDSHIIKFGITVPVLTLKNFSLYALAQTNFYQFETTNDATGAPSTIFTYDSKDKDKSNGYNYFKGTISGTYRTSIANKPVILNANFSGDGWTKGFEKLQGTFSAMVVLRNTAASSFTVGLYGMTLFNTIPVMPIIAYTHQFNPNWSLDITMPSRTYLRYQFLNSHRLSLGASMESEQFYIKPGLADLPEVCLYSKATIKPELVYEFIINKHFYLIARGGAVGVIKGGFYGTDRKGIDNDPYIELSHPMTPFLNLGVSYNLFK